MARVIELEEGDIVKEIKYNNAALVVGPLVVIEIIRHGPQKRDFKKDEQFPTYIEYRAKRLLKGEYDPKGAEFNFTFNKLLVYSIDSIEVVGKMERSKTIIKQVFPWQDE
jgi:hypothetical protein